MTNPVRDALADRRFSYMVELVAGAKTTEDQLVENAAGFMQVPGVLAGSVTSFAGGSAGHDPVRIGSMMQARGLTPNIHLTCVGRDRLNIARALEELKNLGIENVFAITGDFPKGSKETAETLYDLDSVQLVEFINEFRQQTRHPFHISVAVSPFKYTEADCAYQYLKLEKKIAEGADYAITQLGFDSKKFRELKRYLDERGLRTPVLGNVYVLPLGAAKKFNKGEPPGCFASNELVAQIQAEVDASTDKGLVARMERAARMVAIVRGLGYAGAYIGGDHQAERINWIIKRSETLAPQWEELAAELEYAPKGGFYFFESPKHAPPRQTFGNRVADIIEPANTPGWLRPVLTGALAWIDKMPAAARALESAELAFKKPVFGCQACGNCVLGLMEYVCPMTCPKNLRNGPCGGTLNGQCEVIPEQACIWVKVYERAQAANRVDELKTYIPQRDRSLTGTSSYINYFLDRDSRPEHPQKLIQITGATALANSSNK
ncbi:MAG TPA: methylenetetrahydrofolate reductase C-terminal domain-containing protein [Bryobacteraceae bacterium]